MRYKALLFCPDEKIARIVTQVLSDLDFQVEPWNEPFAAVKKLTAEHFDAVVVDCESEQNAALIFKSAKNSSFNHQSLSVAVVEGQAGVAQAFRLGANLVLTKPINVEQAKGTLRVARGLLRKNEGAKPTTAPSAIAPLAAKPIVPAPVTEIRTPSAAKAPVTPPPVFTPPPAVPAPAASVFEVEEEPEVKPDLAEAALLESMPDPMAGAKISQGNEPAEETKKEYPWQPVTKSADLMASALQHPAEVSAKVEFAPPATAPIHPPSSVQPPSFAGLGLGAAAAPAPAKEIAPDEEFSAPSVVEPPSFSSLGGNVEPHDSDGGRGKKIVLVAAIIALAAAGAYFGWTKLHHGTAASPAPALSAPAQASTSPTLPPTSPTPAPVQTSGNSTAATEPAASKPEQMPDLTLSTVDTPAPKTKSTASPAPAIAKSAPAAPPHETFVVKSEAPQPPRPSTPLAEPVEPPAPGMLSVGQSSGDKALSGIVDAPTSAISQPVAAMTLSQGVAQGLLMKRVPPMYPQQARQARIQGAVELQATIGKDGTITNLKQLSGEKILGRAAVDAVKQWKYRPYLLDGQPVEIQTQITVNFKLP